jgi:Antibiotic biosynthesis monooxygenase
MLVSVTRLRVRSLWFLPAFLRQTFRSNRQVANANGFRGGRLLVDRRRTFWTLTAWDDERAMKSFRGSGAHAQVMPRLFHWCDEAAYTHWPAKDDEIAEWPEAYERLVREGRLSRVEHPSADHAQRKFPEPRLKPMICQEIKPTLSKRNAA